jgi:hypothetical protein
VSLLDDLKTVKPRKLSLPDWLLSREPAERAAFEATCADNTVPTDSLLQIVRKHGGATTRDTLNEYRRRVAAR